MVVSISLRSFLVAFHDIRDRAILAPLGVLLMLDVLETMALVFVDVLSIGAL